MNSEQFSRIGVCVLSQDNVNKWFSPEDKNNWTTFGTLNQNGNLTTRNMCVCWFVCLALAHFSAHSKSTFNCRSFRLCWKIYIFISLLLINFWSFLFLSHLHSYPIYNFFDGCAGASVRVHIAYSLFFFFTFHFVLLSCVPLFSIYSCHLKKKKHQHEKNFRQSQKQEKKNEILSSCTLICFVVF